MSITRADMMHLRRALAVASTSTCRQRHGAILAAGKRVLAVGVNTSRTNPLNCTHPKTESAFHAEVTVLRQLRGVDLSRATLYVARLTRNQEPGNSRPCNYCAGALDTAGVSQVLWTTGNPETPYEKWRL